MTIETSTESTGGSDAFTPAEAAYFSSKGTDTAALDAEIAGNGSNQAAGGDQQPGQGNAPANSEAAGGDPEGSDEEGEEVVVVGKDGRPRVNGRFVPHQALHKERERHKSTKQELDSVREKQARADERLAVLNEILTQADAPAAPANGQQQDDQPVDPIADPIGALNQALRQIKTLEAKITDEQKRTGERESDRAMRTAYQQDALSYVKEKPEFGQAYKFLIDGRHRELEAMGMSDANQRNQFIANEERGLVAEAMRLKRSPSQMMHNLAIARGFAAKAPADPVQDNAKKIEQIAAGQKAAGASLSNAGGSSGEGLTAAALADMSEEEFAAVSAKVGKAKIRQLLGG